MKARYLKHSVWLMYKTELLEVSSEVHSKLLGQKRKRGRPKKLPACLTRSPQPQSPNSTYHYPSQEIPKLHLSHKQQEDPQGIPIVSIIKNKKRSRELEEFSDLHPAKQNPGLKKSRLLMIVDEL